MILPLNPDQEIAANSIHGDYVVVAGPGAGKTAVFVQRFMRMITTHRIPVADILNLTFTNSAASEMVERVGLSDMKHVFRTFHSYAMELLERESAFLPFSLNEGVINPGAQFQLIKDLLKIYPAITTFNSLKDKIEEWQAADIDPDRAIEESYNLKGTEYFYAAAYKDYERKSREQGWLDFHGVMKEAVRLLESNEDARKRNQKKYIAVDECQDTDTTQFRFLQLIYGGNIFVVGDENQLIYEWRSAKSGNLSSFSRTFPGAKTLYLGQNYRSTIRLVKFFKEILPVDNGLASHMVSMREEGTDPTFTKYQDEYEEANIVLRCITDPEKTAIIARTNRQLMTFQKMATARGIKSMVLGRKDWWQQNEVKDLLDLAKERIHDRRPANEVLQEVMERHNLINRYRNTGGPNEKNPVENLNDAVKMGAKKGTIKEYLEWLRKLTYGIDAAKKKPLEQRRDKTPVLTLSTVHQMKGREAKIVFVIGVNQKLMPHVDGEVLEEKRIFFVACSRAADELHISYWGNQSEFLNVFVDRIEIYGKEK